MAEKALGVAVVLATSDTTVYENTSGADIKKVLVVVMNYTDSFAHVELFVGTDGTSSRAEQVAVADVPPRGQMSFPIPDLPDTDFIIGKAETATSLNARPWEVNP